MKKFKDNGFIEISITVSQKCLRSCYNVKFMEHRLQEVKLTSCMIMPTHIWHDFIIFFFSCKSEVTLQFPSMFGSLESLIGKP